MSALRCPFHSKSVRTALPRGDTHLPHKILISDSHSSRPARRTWLETDTDVDRQLLDDLPFTGRWEQTISGVKPLRVDSTGFSPKWPDGTLQMLSAWTCPGAWEKAVS